MDDADVFCDLGNYRECGTNEMKSLHYVFENDGSWLTSRSNWAKIVDSSSVNVFWFDKIK